MKLPSKWLENAIVRVREHDQEMARNETAILQILLEVESKKEYADLGFDGLYSFCIKTFGWSESQTSTRTQAMYAMRAVPEIKTKIDSGSMSVTTVAQIQRYIRQEQVEAGVKLTKNEKLQVFESFEMKTSVEVKDEIARMRGERIKLKLSLELDAEAEELWNEVRNLSAHQTQGSTLNCLKVLMKAYIQQKKKELDPRRTSSLLTKVSSVGDAGSRTIPIEVRRKVYARDQHRCKNCSSSHALQVDHIIPVAMGGKSDLHNLRLLCQSCNIREGIRVFGERQMRRPGTLNSHYRPR